MLHRSSVSVGPGPHPGVPILPARPARYRRPSGVGRRGGHGPV